MFEKLLNQLMVAIEMFVSGNGQFTATIFGKREVISVARTAEPSAPLGHLTLAECFSIVEALFSGAQAAESYQIRVGDTFYTVTISAEQPLPAPVPGPGPQMYPVPGAAQNPGPQGSLAQSANVSETTPPQGPHPSSYTNVPPAPQ